MHEVPGSSRVLCLLVHGIDCHTGWTQRQLSQHYKYASAFQIITTRIYCPRHAHIWLWLTGWAIGSWFSTLKCLRSKLINVAWLYHSPVKGPQATWLSIRLLLMLSCNHRSFKEIKQISYASWKRWAGLITKQLQESGWHFFQIAWIPSRVTVCGRIITESQLALSSQISDYNF